MRRGRAMHAEPDQSSHAISRRTRITLLTAGTAAIRAVTWITT